MTAQIQWNDYHRIENNQVLSMRSQRTIYDGNMLWVFSKRKGETLTKKQWETCHANEFHQGDD